MGLRNHGGKEGGDEEAEMGGDLWNWEGGMGHGVGQGVQARSSSPGGISALPQEYLNVVQLLVLLQVVEKWPSAKKVFFQLTASSK